MCGIAGIANFDGKPVLRSELEAMNNMHIHRGPDEGGIWLGGMIGFAHRRLSIIDLASGKQPLSNEDGSVITVFNGEIYNHLELRKNLESKGHRFKTVCDTEVIIHLYEEYGKDCISYLNGMFAFAIYDMNTEYLLLARDRLGQKPLVYFHQGSVFSFASELQSLSKNTNMPDDIDLQSFHDYLILQYVPCPATIYRNVHKLPPGYMLEVNVRGGTTRLSTYWQCQYDNKCDLSYEDAKVKLRKLLEDAVEKRLMSDVPLGAFLSGGTDSTIITGLMAQICKEPVKTFTIGFEKQTYDERHYARIASEKFSTEHYEKIVNPADFEVLEKLVSHYGEPFSDASMLPTYLLSKFTRENVTVALSGDGADELFAGYYRYLVMKYGRLADCIPLPVRKTLCGMLSVFFPGKTEERTFSGKARRILRAASVSKEDRYLNIISRFKEETIRRICGEKLEDLHLKKSPIPGRSTSEYIKAIYSRSSAENSVERIMETDLQTYLPGDILTKIDIASMAVSLELRSPFLDHRVVEFATSLPLEYKQHGNSRKHILKDAFKDLIPPELQKRRKMGFGVPVADWFRNEWKELIRERLLDAKSVSDGYFEKSNLEILIKEHQDFKADHSYALWALLIFELWRGHTSTIN